MKDSTRKWWVLATMCLLTVVLNFEISAINFAIPVIAHQFHAPLPTMQWVINAYVMLSAMFQILGGRLGVSYGHRKILLVGTVLFVLSSAVAGAAQGESVL